MKKKVTVILATMLSLCMLTACGKGDYKADVNTVFVCKDGSIVTTDVEDFEEDTYDKDSLKTYVDDAIQTYNDAHEDGAVKVMDLTVKEGKATLMTEYKTAKDYSDFNGIELFAGTILDAKEAGYKFDTSFAEIHKGDVKGLVDKSAFYDEDKYKIVIIKGNTNVHVKGNILYASTENVEMVDNKTVCIRPGQSLVKTEEEPENTAATEIVQETEEGESTESLDEEVTFNFPTEDKAQSAAESEISNVYTYIIYK